MQGVLTTVSTGDHELSSSNRLLPFFSLLTPEGPKRETYKITFLPDNTIFVGNYLPRSCCTFYPLIKSSPTHPPYMLLSRAAREER
jgi:hypothetical protein